MNGSVGGTERAMRMSSSPITSEDEAQRIHDEAQAADPEHDRVGCWCCCWDCDFDFAKIVRSQ